MPKKWKYHPDQCDRCGSDSEIYTDAELEEGYGYDSDPMRCVECGAVGQWVVYSEDEAYSNWDIEQPKKASCPYCHANNLVTRNKCWQCGRRI